MAPTDRSDDTDQTTTPKENTETASRQSQTTDHQISFDEEQAPTPTDADAKQLTTAPDASAEETNGWDETSAPGRGTEAEITQEQISAAIDHPDGHLDSEHIGKTDTELADRLAAKPWLSGSTSFPDRATAESVCTQAISQNRDDFNAWRQANGPPRLPLEYAGDTTVGRGFTGDNPMPHDMKNAIIVVQRDDTRDDNGMSGWHFKTGHPVDS